MSKIFQCSYCDKTFANRHNLSRHRKAFHLKNILSDGLRDRGNGLMVDYSKIDQKGDDDDNEDDDYDDADDDDEDDGNVDGLWKLLIPYNCKGNDIFGLLEDIIELYRWSQTDKIFKTLMVDVEQARELGYSSSDAIDYALCKSKTDIIEAITNCENEDGFWSALSNRDIQDVGVFVRIFYAMEHDKLIQKIVKDGEPMQRHPNELRDRYKHAGSGLYLSPFVVH